MDFNWSVAIVIFLIVAIVGGIIAFIVIYELNNKQHVAVGLPITIAVIIILIVGILGAIIAGKFASKRNVSVSLPDTGTTVTMNV